MAELEVAYVPLEEIEGVGHNPKGHSVKTIKASMRRFGFADPVVMDERTGRLVSGHGRTEALLELRADGDVPPEGIITENGAWMVPAVRGWASQNDDERDAALVALNRTTEVGGWDESGLLDLLERLESLDDGLVGVGYDDETIQDLRDRLAAMERDPWGDRKFRAAPLANEVQSGQVWKVGPHLVACGDATDPGIWDRLLGEVKPQLFVTDPPYGIDYSGGGVERERIEADTPEDAPQLLGDVLDIAAERVRQGAASYVFLPPGDQVPPIAGVLHERGLWRWTLVWAKDNATFARSDYQQQHEWLIYGWFPGAARLHPVEDRTQTTLWQHPRPSRSEHHPTEKPVEVCARAITNSSREGWVMIDPFAGSGSTLVAAAQKNRVATGIELYPGYVEVALHRLAGVVGEDPELMDEGT